MTIDIGNRILGVHGSIHERIRDCLLVLPPSGSRATANQSESIGKELGFFMIKLKNDALIDPFLFYDDPLNLFLDDIPLRLSHLSS
jgi:hypothetical protein